MQRAARRFPRHHGGWRSIVKRSFNMFTLIAFGVAVAVSARILYSPLTLSAFITAGILHSVFAVPLSSMPDAP